MNQLDRDLQREMGIPAAWYELLSLLGRQPSGSIRMHQLAADTQSSPSRITNAVDRMAERGWVERRDCADDRRGCSAVLTPAGREVHHQAARGPHRSVRDHLLAHLSADKLDELCAISRSVLDHLCTVRRR